MDRRKLLKGIGAGAGIAAGGLVLPTVVAETMGPNGPEVDDPREPSFWEKDAGLFPQTASLKTDIQADVAVIGSGITGLSAAMALKELRPDYKVVVLDSKSPCSGSSSRNSGHLVGEYHAWGSILSSEGLAAAREWNGFAARGLESMLDFIRRNSIECNLRKEPLMVVGTKEQVGGLENLAQQMREAGLGGRLITGEKFQDQAGTSYYYGGVENNTGYIMHPGRLMRGFLERVLLKGVDVFRDSPVLSVESTDSTNESNILKTPSCTVAAKKLLFATNAYTPRLKGLLSSRFVPIHVAIVATRPMSDAEKIRAGFSWDNLKENQLLSRTFGVTPDKRVFMRGIFGYAAFNSCVWKNPEAGYTRLEREMRERLPWVEGLEVTEKWCGPVAMNISGCPVAGPLPVKGRYVSACYNGVGMVDGYYHGRLVAHQMVGSDHPDLKYLKGPSGWIPPEPSRSIGAKTFLFFGLRI